MNYLENIALVLALRCVVACGTDAGTTQGMEHSNTANAPASVAYVGLFGDNALAVVDMTQGKVKTTIPVTAPDGIAITPDGKKVYVSSNDSGAVAVIDTGNDSVKTTIQVGAQPSGMVATEDGKYVIVAVQGDGDAAIIDTTTDAVVARAPIGKAHSAATNADGTQSFVSSQATGAPAVQVVDVPSGTPAGTFPVEAAPRALADVDGKLYVTLVGSADVDVLDAKSGQKLRAITTDGSPHDVRPTRDGSQVLTVSQTAGELVFIDPATSTLVTHVATGTMPHWIGLPSDGREAYVTNEGDNDVVVVDLATRAVTKTFAVGQAPRKIVVRP